MNALDFAVGFFNTASYLGGLVMFGYCLEAAVRWLFKKRGQ